MSEDHRSRNSTLLAAQNQNEKMNEQLNLRLPTQMTRRITLDGAHLLGWPDEILDVSLNEGK
jgi:hypothetical protein